VTSLAWRIHQALPQTQCTRCGYPDCEGYAQAIAQGTAAINQCPPGGAEGVARLSELTGQPVLPLNPDNGLEGPRTVAFIDEAWCIGCTLCLDACPTDAIVGANKQMHTVIEAHCTGCERCLPVCPVDCIELETVAPDQSGWAAWSTTQAQHALQRYDQKKARLEKIDRAAEAQATKMAEDLAQKAKSSVLQAVLARAKAAKA
jgi:electron transport complex protein RnfB